MGVKRDLDAAGMTAGKDAITEDEAALYDRQIRLWGVECQKRLKEARVLAIGINGIAAEVVKNIVLCGIKSVTILDEKLVNPPDFTANFFLADAELGQNRAEACKSAVQELNPNVQVIIDTESIRTKPIKFYMDFDVICCFDCPSDVVINVNKMCRETDVLFFCGDTWGFYGYFFLDLKVHSCTRVKKDREGQEKTVPKVLHYCTFHQAIKTKVGAGLSKKCNKVYILFQILSRFRDKHGRFPSPNCRDQDIIELKEIRSAVAQRLEYDQTKITDEMLSKVFAELSPTCAIVGGAMANEIIKAVSRKGKPVCNFYLFDGEECTAVVERVAV